MSSIIIAFPGEVPRRYPIPESFTYRELQTIKTVTGLRPGDFENALTSGDPDIVIALAVICSGRAGHKITPDMLLDLEVGAISVDDDEEESPTTAATAAATDEDQTPTLEDGGTQD